MGMCKEAFKADTKWCKYHISLFAVLIFKTKTYTEPLFTFAKTFRISFGIPQSTFTAKAIC